MGLGKRYYKQGDIPIEEQYPTQSWVFHKVIYTPKVGDLSGYPVQTLESTDKNKAWIKCDDKNAPKQCQPPDEAILHRVVKCQKNGTKYEFYEFKYPADYTTDKVLRVIAGDSYRNILTENLDDPIV